ncbi:uncharacterized protein LOC131222527 isoform X4 [Magnolia sinica]|uniref:uncharacterized protein LOC131222527 isoform X4 n=1 Tax=Magnolia sinica TaxID=86752 RepID=UPI0026591E59|nr:uncharacterized protein LOC131222527 isoform X4 [Magnolia sinica]
MPEIPSSASKSPAARGSRQQHYSKKKKPADASQLPAISTREKSRFFPPFPSIGSGRASETQPLSHSQDSESGIGFRAGINLSTKLHQSWNLTVGFTGCTARILYIARCSILTSSADQSDFTRGIGGGIWVKIL